MNSYFVYILASDQNGTLYIGVTNNLERRILEHKSGIFGGFTKKYSVTRLVYFEETPGIDSALIREKQLKNWQRKWKIELIERDNPNWYDLATDL